MSKPRIRRNYSRLEGKEVKMVFPPSILEPDAPREYIGVVTGADYWVGLTIQHKTTKDYMLCINGPKSPLMKSVTYSGKLHRALMPFVYDCIMHKGVIESIEYIRTAEAAVPVSMTGHPSAANCAFSQ